VLDPFSGTASTSVAAASWGRDSIGVEVEPSYHEMALKRLSTHADDAAQLGWDL
jgi:modification methylase